MLIFDVSGTQLIEMVEGRTFLLQPEMDDSLSNKGVAAKQNGVSFNGAVVVDSGPKQRTFSARREEKLFRFENAIVEMNIGNPGPLQTGFSLLLKTEWKSVNRFSWFYADAVGGLSMSDSLTFDRDSKTLEKTTESGNGVGRTKFKMRFLGVTPQMLEAVMKEPDVRADTYCGEWGQEVYLPKYGVRAVEVLQTNAVEIDTFIPSANWNKWKMKVIWRCPRPKHKKKRSS